MTFFVFAVTPDLHVKCLISLFMKTLTGNDEIFLPFLNLDMVLRNSTPEEFVFICQSK